MVNLKRVYMAQTRYVYEIACDIKKHGASQEVCLYADKYATVDSTFGTSGGEASCNFVRVQFGEAYAYIELDSFRIWFNNDEMGCNGSTFDEIVRELHRVDNATLYRRCIYAWCYDDIAGIETEYSESLAYHPMEGAK